MTEYNGISSLERMYKEEGAIVYRGVHPTLGDYLHNDIGIIAAENSMFPSCANSDTYLAVDPLKINDVVGCYFKDYFTPYYLTVTEVDGNKAYLEDPENEESFRSYTIYFDNNWYQKEEFDFDDCDER